MYLPKYVKNVLNILKDNQYKAFIVGGAVRDYLLGKTPNDFDIATNAKPQEIVSLFKSYHLITKGIKHGTIIVLINRKQVEITTFRIEDDYKDFRHPQKVCFVDDLFLDLSRRDFTINALAYDNGIIDYFNGKNDLQNKLIRCVGEPDLRFQEDALRILRALRFACVLDFEIETKTKVAIINNKDLLKNISYERINIEFDKMLLTNIEKIIIPYFLVFKVIIPELELSQIKNNIKIINNLPKNRILRLAGLFNRLKNPQLIMQRLKYPKKLQQKVLTIINKNNLKIVNDKKELKKILIDIDIDDLKNIVAFKNAQGENININSLLDKIKDDVYKLSDLAIKGSDLITIGVPKNEKIAHILRKLLILVVEEKIPNEKDILISYVKDKLMNDV